MAETAGWEPYVDRSNERTVWLERIAAGRAKPRSPQEARLALALSSRLSRRHKLVAMFSAILYLVFGLSAYAAVQLGALSVSREWYLIALPPIPSLVLGSLWQKRLVERNIPVLQRLATNGNPPTS